MLRMVGTLSEAEKLKGKLPEKVFLHLVWSASVLDSEYGKTRDYMRDGGYTLVAETAEDVQEMKRYVDYDRHVYEWAKYLGDGNSYISALYLMNNDFSIVLMIPTSVAPASILREMEEEEE